LAGTLVDRYGGRPVLAASLVVLALGYGAFVLVHAPWQGFLAAALAGIGNGLFWPAQSTLLAALSPPDRRHATFAMQRVMMNLGIGIGALVGGLIANTDRPGTFVAVFLLDAMTFLVYLGVLLLAVPDPDLGRDRRSERGGSYAEVVRHGAFVGVVGLNTLFIFAGMSGFELLPVFAMNEVGVDETAIGLIFFFNTVVIVVAQLPIAKLSEGHRRRRMLAVLGALWAACSVAVSIVGGSVDGTVAAVLLAVVMGAFGIGECLHGAVQSRSARSGRGSSGRPCARSARRSPSRSSERSRPRSAGRPSSSPPDRAGRVLRRRGAPEEGDDGEHASMGVAVGRQVELPEDRADVRLHRVLREPELLRDAGVGLALRHQPEDFSLARRQRRQRVSLLRRRQQLLHDLGVER
jgi:predicted MFS family arabinose efflux permease